MTALAAPQPPSDPPLAPPDGVDGVAEAPPVDPAVAAAALEAAEREAQLARLMQRMQKTADFPALKDSIRGIQKISRSDTAHLRALSDEVLGDVGLTNKLLRLINTAFYSSVGGGGITSIKRAIALMGFQSIGMLAASLALFEKLPKGPDGERVRAEFRRALLAGMLASEMCPGFKHQELAYLSALFQNLGTMLGWMHFKDEAAEIEAKLVDLRAAAAAEEAEAGATAAQEDAHPDPHHSTVQQTAREVLGIGFEDLGVEVARQWGWPEDLQLALRRLHPRDPEQPASSDERLRVACTAANLLAARLENLHDPEQIEACLADFLPAWAVPLGITDEMLAGMVERARGEWIEMATLLGLPVPPGVAGKGGKSGKAVPAKVASSAGNGPELIKPKTAATGAGAARPAPPPVVVPAAVGQALGRALEAVSELAMSDAPLGAVLQALMTQIQQALQLQRIVVCLREPASGDLVGRIGLGDRASTLAPQFRIALNPPSCLFGLLCAKNADTLISDAADPVIAQRLPAWYARQVQAPTFLLLPLKLGDKPLGLIYGDRTRAHSLQVGDAELTQLKAMRNQLIMAMRMRGAAG
ncbi:HDOD domain-containing protein [Sphaerotilus mobilis]|uniref:HD-like signal output (HDOD) protein n=1 Tax=Sphaerotilus mobilis TaxID=47994 RepID=A0A4Q7LCG0_9BURK|nr:HDOD domain-containing protein [Sphaerotilus mobilis]RZS52066.1 HD-like signal output (HDOD) protein [Sphaerotilus mobilis]